MTRRRGISPQAKGWQTRRARAAARSAAAVKGWITRRRNIRIHARAEAKRLRAVEHGRRARVRTESRLTPAERRARTLDAKRIEAETQKPAPRAGAGTIHTLRELDGYDPNDDGAAYDTEGHAEDTNRED